MRTEQRSSLGEIFRSLLQAHKKYKEAEQVLLKAQEGLGKVRIDHPNLSKWLDFLKGPDGDVNEQLADLFFEKYSQHTNSDAPEKEHIQSAAIRFWNKVLEEKDLRKQIHILYFGEDDISTHMRNYLISGKDKFISKNIEIILPLVIFEKLCPDSEMLGWIVRDKKVLLGLPTEYLSCLTQSNIDKNSKICMIIEDIIEQDVSNVSYSYAHKTEDDLKKTFTYRFLQPANNLGQMDAILDKFPGLRKHAALRLFHNRSQQYAPPKTTQKRATTAQAIVFSLICLAASILFAFTMLELGVTWQVSSSVSTGLLAIAAIVWISIRHWESLAKKSGAKISPIKTNSAPSAAAPPSQAAPEAKPVPQEEYKKQEEPSTDPLLLTAGT